MGLSQQLEQLLNTVNELEKRLKAVEEFVGLNSEGPAQPTVNGRPGTYGWIIVCNTRAKSGGQPRYLRNAAARGSPRWSSLREEAVVFKTAKDAEEDLPGLGPADEMHMSPRVQVVRIS